MLTQVGQLALRSVVRTLRQPAMVIPSIAFPMILLAVNSAGLKSATRLPGFPTNSYLTFALAITFIQGALFAAMSSGTNVANDIETGFLNRLALTPLRRSALMLGQLAGIIVLGLIQATTFLVVGAIAGAGFHTGLPGALVIVAIAVLIALGFGTLGAFIALRTGSGEAVQGLFPLLFAALFLSSMAMPRDLISADWFRTIATYNPVSYLFEGLRSLVITGWDATALWRGVAVGVGVLALSFWAASRALATRMART
jgi:ABC-2 type transport system permease protein